MKDAQVLQVYQLMSGFGRLSSALCASWFVCATTSGDRGVHNFQLTENPPFPIPTSHPAHQRSHPQSPGKQAIMLVQRDSFTFRRGFLLWMAAGAVACLPTIGLTPFMSLFVGSLLVAAWIISNIRPKRLITSIFISVLEIFFREMGARNQYKVPPENVPAIFVCAPHANQFLDPFVVMNAVGRHDLCYLAAAKSVRLRFVGLMARVLDSIPVERAEDVAFKGQGTVWISPEDGVTVLGRGTAFSKQLSRGDSINVEGYGVLSVKEVCSDEQLTLKKPAVLRLAPDDDGDDDAAASAADDGSAYRPFRVNPFIDQSAMFDAVHEALHAGKAVGIFPEGGSHDRPSMLPFKAGVAIMALGALAKHPNMPLRLVPVGLNYFSGHRFRSRVFVDIGEPLTVPADLLPRYKQGGDEKRAATNELMTIVNTALSAVTISAPDYDTLEFFWTLRRLVRSASAPMSLDDQTELARRFATGYDRVLPDGRLWKDTERVRTVRVLTAEYNNKLKSLLLRDYQVANVLRHMTRGKALCLFLGRFIMLLAAFILWLPMTLLSLPLLVLTRLVSATKAKQAVAKSSVKIHGNDVAATWKVLVALILAPVLWITYTSLSGTLAAYAGLDAAWEQETRLLTFFLLPLLAYAFILLSEQMLAIVRSLLPLLVIAGSPAKAQELIEQRHQLQLAMRTLVDDEFGWRADSEMETTPRESTPSRAQEEWVGQWSKGDAPSFPASPTVTATALASTAAKPTSEFRLEAPSIAGPTEEAPKAEPPKAEPPMPPGLL